MALHSKWKRVPGVLVKDYYYDVGSNESYA